MNPGPVLLEEWMRLYYFSTEIDIGSSGVENFSLAELRQLLGFGLEELDEIVFRDSESLGGLNLRRSIAARWTAHQEDRVLVTHGSSEALFLAMTALLEPGDRVVVLNPCYPQHHSLAQTAGCRVDFWPLREECGFRPDLDEAARLIGQDVRMVVVNFPHNPTGATLTPEELDTLLLLVARSGAYLVWDGAFAELIYAKQPLIDPVLRYDRVLSIGTLSKAYGLPGLRVGWCLSSPEILRKLVIARDHVTLHLSPLVEFVAEKVIAQAERLLHLRLDQAARNLVILTDWAIRHEDRVRWYPPQGGVCAFVGFRHLDVEQLCHRLARELGVLLVPGTCFNRPAFARLGFGDSTAKLQEGLRRLSHLLSSCR